VFFYCPILEKGETKMDIKNNQTQIDLLLNSIKEIGEGKIAKTEFETTMNSLKEAIDQRNKDLDNQMGDMETNLEKKMAGMVDKISGAFEKASYREVAKEQPKYGKSFGEFLSMVKSQSPEIKALSETTGEAGGYLVPEQFMNEILKVELESSVVRTSGARVIPMTAPILKVPALAYSSNSAGSMYGGVSTYWADAGGALTSSQPKFKKITLQARKLIAYTESEDELVEDSIVSLGGLLQQLFGEVLAFEEDAVFLTGDGVGKPLGILSAPALVTVSRNTASQVVTADIVTMLSRFRGNLGRAKFVVNQSVLPSLYKLKDENNNYIWHPGFTGSIASGSQGTLYGLPIVITEKLPAVGTTGDILLADFGHYLIGDRSGLRVEESIHYKFNNDQKAWRLIKRVDGQPWLESAITPRAGGSTLSPFVAVT
jgi:HK97 family phage major capsid protein